MPEPAICRFCKDEHKCRPPRQIYRSAVAVSTAGHSVRVCHAANEAIALRRVAVLNGGDTADWDDLLLHRRHGSSLTDHQRGVVVA